MSSGFVYIKWAKITKTIIFRTTSNIEIPVSSNFAQFPKVSTYKEQRWIDEISKPNSCRDIP